MSAWIKKKFLACVVLTLLASCSRQDDAVESELGYQLPPGEAHLTFTFAEIPAAGSFKGRPAVTFRIPREYVRFQTVLSKNGQIYQVPLQIELPGPTPWKDRPWLKGKKGTPEWDEFMKGWIGKFIVTVGSGSGVGGRGLFLNSINHKSVLLRTDLVADGEAYGLVRYSPKRCYTDEHLKDSQHKAFLEAKPADDPTPEANCRLSRKSAVYFSPISITDPEQVIFMRCADASCDASFNFAGRGASMGFRQEQLSRWPDIINPTRKLLHSFIVRDVSGNTSSPPPSPAIPSSR
ncbi:hypothetical protein [Hydrogenophaga sp.]|uniref:hypothetical protein n=1 Tax=Hydrogenophaga sp. TaxID=1904254 RepID=UPI002730E8DA|nr:hypothetical protein [Hydrogenophaga sp.]MDP2015593.1 hypothetical protein [Hydrogenophaga sp.]MDP3167196.1 hypothetical protein [Hydrogenophaga sp.]